METFPVVVLGAMALYGLYAVNYDQKPTQYIEGVNQKGGRLQKKKNKGAMQTNLTTKGNEGAKKEKILLDMAESGMTYGIERAQHLNLTNLNEAYKPYSAPPQKSSHSIAEFLNNQASKNAYLENNATPFYFWRDGEIPLATTQQSNPNVEIPSRKSIKGDRFASLASYSRVYVDSGYDTAPPNSSARDKMLGQGEPETYEVPHVPEEGKLNRDWNVYGPGGVNQVIYNQHHERLTRSRGANRSHIVASRSAGYKKR